MRKRHAWWLTGLSLLLAVPVTYALSSAREAAWHPFAVLWGGGVKAPAVAEMHRLAEVADALLHRRELDAPTQGFIDGVLSDLADFDLAKLQQRLPRESDDGFRELRVRGELNGRAYRVRQPAADEAFQVTMNGPRDQLGAASLVVRAKRLWTVNDRKAYSFGGQAGVGIGNVRWDAVVAAAEDAARMVGTATVDGQPLQSSEAARQEALRAHPKLGAEDLAIVGVAFDAYPALSAFVSKFGQVEDVRTVLDDRGYQKLTVSVRGLPQQYEKEYPLSAEYARRMLDLVRARGRWVDKHGRTLATASMDSKDLTATVSCYLKDGRLLAFKGDRVFEGDPIDPMSDDLARSQVVATGWFKMFGITIKLSDAELDATYTPHAGYAEFAASFTKVPKVDISGAALGFISTDMVDAFIPGTMAGLTRDFLSTAANAHRGKGATASGKVGTSKQRGIVEGQGEAVLLDNALISMAVSMVNERFFPTPALIAELERIAEDAQRAFMRDLAAYEAGP